MHLLITEPLYEMTGEEPGYGSLFFIFLNLVLMDLCQMNMSGLFAFQKECNKLFQDFLFDRRTLLCEWMSLLLNILYFCCLLKNFGKIVCDFKTILLIKCFFVSLKVKWIINRGVETITWFYFTQYYNCFDKSWLFYFYYKIQCLHKQCAKKLLSNKHIKFSSVLFKHYIFYLPLLTLILRDQTYRKKFFFL